MLARLHQSVHFNSRSHRLQKPVINHSRQGTWRREHHWDRWALSRYSRTCFIHSSTSHDSYRGCGPAYSILICLIRSQDGSAAKYGSSGWTPRTGPFATSIFASKFMALVVFWAELFVLVLHNCFIFALSLMHEGTTLIVTFISSAGSRCKLTDGIVFSATVTRKALFDPNGTTKPLLKKKKSGCNNNRRHIPPKHPSTVTQAKHCKQMRYNSTK